MPIPKLIDRGSAGGLAVPIPKLIDRGSAGGLAVPIPINRGFFYQGGTGSRGYCQFPITRRKGSSEGMEEWEKEGEKGGKDQGG